MLRVGTSHFATIGHAERYYAQYGYDHVSRAVAQKLKDGEIHVGPPPLKDGERSQLDEDGRYVIIQP